MAIRVRYFIRVSKKTETAPIRVRFSNGRQFDVYANTGEQIKQNYWNNKQGTVRDLAEYRDKDKMRKRLDNIREHILSEYDHLPDKSKVNSEWLDQTIDKFHSPNKYIQKGTSLFSYIQHFVDNADKRINPKTGNPICYKMQREYAVTFEYLKKYAQKYVEPDFADIDLDFYNNFTAMLRDEGLQPNTVGKKVQTLKIFLNAATEDGINEYQKYKSRNFKSISVDTDNVALNSQELSQIYEYDLSKRPGLERVRDLFIVACWTGLRYSDLNQVTPDRIENGLLMVRQTKTQGEIWIPLHPVVTEILDKYKGKLPEPLTNQKYNESIKAVAKLVGLKSPVWKTTYVNGKRISKKYAKHELVSSHTARRSFATIQYREMSIPTPTIRAITGHQSEIAFLKYIRVTPKEHAEIMRDMWQVKGYHMKVAK